jgi:hypothetical protein
VEHHHEKPPREGEDNLITGDTDLHSPPMPQLLPLENDIKEDEGMDATEPTHLPKLNLKPNLLEPVPLLSHLRPASLPREASD